MLPVKIQCGCGQRYAFDIEPVCGRMMGRVACPVCGLDGTRVANEIIAFTLAAEISRHDSGKEIVMIFAVIGCMIAGIAGVVAVVLCMLVYYKKSGINATIALVLNAVILIALLGYFGATLTLPGIAGIILTIGMAVDSNVLIFERIREELRSGKGVAVAIDSGFQKAFLTIIDTHVTTVVSCLFLFIFGSTQVRGFAVTLVIGLLANLFTAVFVSRFIFDWELSGKKQVESLSI